MLFGFLTPVTFTLYGVLAKHLNSKEIGFNASTITFSSYMVNHLVLLLVGGLPYWLNFGFNLRFFVVGLVGSTFNALGVVFSTNALAISPMGQVVALQNVACLILVIIESIKKGKMITYMEGLGLLSGMYGALVLVIPEFFSKYCFCCCLNKSGKTLA